MKKVIEIEDGLYEKLEKIQNDYHIKTVSPVISLILTLGVKWFEKLNKLEPTMNVPTPIQYPWIIPWTLPVEPYQPWYDDKTGDPYKWKIWCNDGTSVTITGCDNYTIGDWDISSNTSGMSFNYVG